LGDILGEIGAVNLSQHGRVNQVGVADDDLCECRLGRQSGVFAEQLCVGFGLHLNIKHPPEPKSDKICTVKPYCLAGWPGRF